MCGEYSLSQILQNLFSPDAPGEESNRQFAPLHGLEAAKLLVETEYHKHLHLSLGREVWVNLQHHSTRYSQSEKSGWTYNNTALATTNQRSLGGPTRA